VNRNTIALVWLGGLVLMGVVYVVGPQHFFRVCEEAISQAWWDLADLIGTLTGRMFDVLRAAAIALYVVFVVLTFMARRRGLHGGGVLVIVTILFLILLGTGWYASGTKWFAAAVLAGAGAATMTHRLLRMPPPRDPARPWGNQAPGRSDSHPSP
jgi:hypothetical protein